MSLSADILSALRESNNRMVLDGYYGPLTGREAETRVRQLMRSVRSEDDSGRPIVLKAARTPEGYLGFLAILLLGRAVVPVRPDWPPQRIAAVANRVGAAIILEAGAHGGLSSGVCRLPGKSADPCLEGYVYILSTSGTTGTPKLVPISEANVQAFLGIALTRYAGPPRARYSANFDLTFDLGVYDLLVPLLSGGTLCLPSPHEAFLPPDYVEGQRLTHWFSVPSLIRFARASRRLTNTALATLESSFFAGEALQLPDARAWLEAAPQAPLWNLYGPSEMTMACADFVTTIDEVGAITTQTVPIGALYESLRHRILGGGEPQGELVIRGPQMFSGYLDPQDNEGAFVWSEKARWYRTGDLVAGVGRGVYEFRGRVDRQVKVRGHRLELEEVENAYLSVQGVAAASAFVDDAGMELAVVLQVDCPSAMVTAGLAIERLLPSASRPTRVHLAESLPRNANGKTDHQEVRRRWSLL